MSITEAQIIILITYLVLFICLVAFFEVRLNYIHRRHIEKLWPIGEEGMDALSRKLKIIIRIMFFFLFSLSIAIILTIL